MPSANLSGNTPAPRGGSDSGDPGAHLPGYEISDKVRVVARMTAVERLAAIIRVHYARINKAAAGAHPGKVHMLNSIVRLRVLSLVYILSSLLALSAGVSGPVFVGSIRRIR